MKKIILIIIFILSFSEISFGEELVWDVKSTDFWTEIEEEKLNFSAAPQNQLNAQIELDLNSQTFELDLIESIEAGIQNSSSYKISKYQKEYSDWEFRNKLSEFLPNIGYSFSLSDLKGEFLVGGILPRKVHETVYASTFTADWEIFNAKKIFDSIRLKNQQKSKKHNQNYTKDDLILRTSIAYYDLLQKKTEIEIYKYNLIEAQEQLKYNNALYDIGAGTRFDILRAESEVESAKADVENAVLSMKIAQTNLANIIGYPIFSNIQPKDKIIHKLELVDKDLTPDILFSQAVLMRDDIKAKQDSIKALKLQKMSNISEFIPSVSVTWEHAYVGTLSLGGRSNDTIGFLVTAPFGRNLGLNSLTKYKMDNANYMIANTELTKLKNEIEKKITDNYYSIKANEEIIEAKNKQIISTKEGLRQAIARMKIGEATYLDVIEANRLKTQSRIELLAAIVNYNKTQLGQMFEIGLINLMEIKINYEKAKAMFKK